MKFETKLDNFGFSMENWGYASALDNTGQKHTMGETDQYRANAADLRKEIKAEVSDLQKKSDIAYKIYQMYQSEAIDAKAAIDAIGALYH